MEVDTGPDPVPSCSSVSSGDFYKDESHHHGGGGRWPEVGITHHSFEEEEDSNIGDEDCEGNKENLSHSNNRGDTLKSQNETTGIEIKSDGDTKFCNVNGRYLVATRDFLEGELIFKENPLISGPSSASAYNFDGLPVCLTCYSLVQTGFRCRRCGWPVCDPVCAQDPIHLEFECPIFVMQGISPDQFIDPETITILRCLLLRTKCPEKWRTLSELASGIFPLANDKLGEEADLQSENAMALLCTSLTFIHETCGLDRFDYDDVEMMTRVVDCIGLGGEDRQRALLHRYGTYIYEKGSYLRHSCIPNAYRVINLTSQLEVYASVPIKKGDSIKIVYTETFLGTMKRRQFLKEFFYISCNCERCSSPSECDSFFQAVKCRNENCLKSRMSLGGDVDTQAIYLPKRPLDPKSEWECGLCKNAISSEVVLTLEDTIRRELDDIDGAMTMDRVLKLEALAGKHRNNTLHPHHFLILRTEYDIVQRMSLILYRNRLLRTQIEFVERFIELTRKILGVFDIILPGFNRHRGRVLYFLQQGLFYSIQYKTNPNSKKLTTNSLAKLTEEFQEFLNVRNEGRRILSVEPEGSEESLLAKEMVTEGNPEIEALKQVLPRYLNIGEQGST